MAQELKQTLRLQVREAGVIDGFCYPYARLLLDKVLTLTEQDKLFARRSKNNNEACYFTEVGRAVLGALCEQMGITMPESSQDAESVIQSSAEFLAIFE